MPHGSGIGDNEYDTGGRYESSDRREGFEGDGRRQLPIKISLMECKSGPWKHKEEKTCLNGAIATVRRLSARRDDIENDVASKLMAS